MKIITLSIFSLIFISAFAQVPTTDWVIDESYAPEKINNSVFEANYTEIVTLINSTLSGNKRNSFVSKRVYEDIITQHIDTSKHQQIADSYEWLENKYDNVRSKYVNNLQTIVSDLKSIDKVYFRFEDNGNLLTGRASALITSNNNQTYVVIFKNLCKVNNEWHIVNDVKLKAFNQ